MQSIKLQFPNKLRMSEPVLFQFSKQEDSIPKLTIKLNDQCPKKGWFLVLEGCKEVNFIPMVTS